MENSARTEKIQNGFLVHRSWEEKKGKNTDYKSETTFFKNAKDAGNYVEKVMKKAKTSKSNVGEIHGA